MITAGIDIGSRTTKLVLMNGSKIIEYQIRETGIEPLKTAKQMLEGKKFDAIVSTGYGRYLVKNQFDSNVITEITAYAKGAGFLFPDCRTVIDIGGQDTKVIKINNSKVEDFEMNDRCAAGTGKFLEVMAHTMGYKIEEFGDIALQAERSVSVSSMCTVFAESEVISLLSKGEKPKNIALGLHEAIVNRLLPMLSRIGYEDKIVFAGGVAKNKCILKILNKKLGREIIVPEEPQIIGAIGAAVIATDSYQDQDLKTKRR